MLQMFKATAKLSSKTTIKCVLFYTMFLLPVISIAELSDKNMPLQIEADKGWYDNVKQSYELSGKVVLNKGSIIIKTDKANINTIGKGAQLAVARGGEKGLAYLRQKREGLNEFFEAYGNTIEYNSQTNLITITGQAKIIRLDGNNNIIDQVNGFKMIYNGVDETYQALGNENGRVRATISGNSNKTQSNINTPPSKVQIILPAPNGQPPSPFINNNASLPSLKNIPTTPTKK